jgi:hypothetical protein
MTTPESKIDGEQPILRSPGWAVRVYVEVKNTNGADALQKVILGLMHAGVPGLAGSLANELCLEETIVESVLKTLHADDWIHWDGGEWKKTTKTDQFDVQIERRVGWVFWDSLRHRLLSELLLDDNGAALGSDTGTIADCDVLKSEDFHRPTMSQVRAELIPTVEARGFNVRALKQAGNESKLENVSESLLRVSLQNSSRKMRWHPLIIPYRIEANLGTHPSIYCCEPVYSCELSHESPYNPFLRAVIEDKIEKAYHPVSAFAEDLQRKVREKHGAAFLAKMGGSERLDADARNAVLRMLGGTRVEGPFASPTLLSAAEDAERIWLTTAELPQSSKSLRTQYSSILQALAACLSDEMLPLWEGNHSVRSAAKKFPSSWDAGKRRLSFEDSKQRWNAEVSRFSRKHAMPFHKWGISTAGEMKSAATFDRRRTQLGLVLRCWAAFAIAAEGDSDGRFVLSWIRESLNEFPRLFEIFETVKDQRNLDKGRSSENIPIGEYRDAIYKMWKAIAEAHRRATEQRTP